MGRYEYSDRLKADSLHAVSIYYLKKHGYLKNHSYGSLSWSCRGEETGSIGFEISLEGEEKFIRLDYIITRRSSGKVDKFDYKIPIVSTACNFGGSRYWFKCHMSKGGIYCGRRVAKIYQGADFFACRHCYNLTYESRNENSTYRGYPFNEILSLKKIEDIEKTIKKRTYKGKLTKKSMRIRRIQKKMLSPHVDEGLLERLLYKV